MYLAEIGLELCLAQVCQTQLRDNVLPYFFLSFRLLQQFHWHKGPQQWIYILFFQYFSMRFSLIRPTLMGCTEWTLLNVSLLWIWVCLFQRVFAYVFVYVYVCWILIPLFSVPLKYILPENGSLWYMLFQATCQWRLAPKIFQCYVNWLLVWYTNCSMFFAFNYLLFNQHLQIVTHLWVSFELWPFLTGFESQINFYKFIAVSLDCKK